MTPPPLVSIIVPCYNYGHFLAATLENVATQKFSEWECIIIDDGSTDDTGQVAAKFTESDSRFSYAYQQNAGLPSARNTGLARAKGKYIQFLDADDLLHHDKLQLQTAYMEQNPDTGIVYGDALFFDASPAAALPAPGKRLKISGTGDLIIRHLCINNFIEVSAPLTRRSVLDKVGAFDIAYFTYEDWQYWFRAAVAGVIFVYLPVPGTETYIRQGHSSMLRNSQKKVLYGLQIRKQMMSSLTGPWKLYNIYRIVKLKTRRLLLNLTGR